MLNDFYQTILMAFPSARFELWHCLKQGGIFYRSKNRSIWTLVNFSDLPYKCESIFLLRRLHTGHSTLYVLFHNKLKLFIDDSRQYYISNSITNVSGRIAPSFSRSPLDVLIITHACTELLRVASLRILKKAGGIQAREHDENHSYITF